MITPPPYRHHVEDRLYVTDRELARALAKCIESNPLMRGNPDAFGTPWQRTALALLRLPETQRLFMEVHDGSKETNI